MTVHVAVADVSHYVREGSAIDREAIWRSFSAYLPHRAVPMLPERLSSHMCSLVPEQDRCAMVVSMRLEASGEVADVEVRAAVIHSRARLTYGDVAGELASGDNLPPAIAARVHLLRRAADRLRARRLHRGAVELNLPEIRVVLDEDDPSRIRDIVPSRASREMSRAYNLIEELMVAANEAVGAIAARRRLPIVYRVHAPPDEDRLATLADAAAVLGVRVDPEKLTSPRGVQAFLGRVKAHPRSTSLNMLTLRSMAQAEYRTENLGHFALASDAYVHFTSPIRRYPDVIAHRVMKAWITRQGGKAGPPPVPTMPEAEESADEAQRASLREREIVAAERESKSLFAAAFMRERIGDRFEGAITGMSSAGLFVAIEHPFARRDDPDEHARAGEGGLVRDRPCNVRCTGRKSGFALTLGDRVMVEVVDANIQRRRIEFVLISRLSG
ncbi:MAG: RNB domain-containing ribonuclease [Nannocystaceae bacterium]